MSAKNEKKPGSIHFSIPFLQFQEAISQKLDS